MHTEGPWKINTIDGQLPDVLEIKSSVGEAPTYQSSIIQDSELPFDRICMLDFGYGKPEDQANARLIAAAPELLEALEGNNDLLLALSREMLIREDYRSTVVADRIRDNYEAIRKARKGE